jgi:SDR family mycofactocin-dependent oxidoreductase
VGFVGLLDGKVAFITGAGRGQGRSHAVRLASEGAAIIATDSLKNVATVVYDMATLDDLEDTARAVKDVGGRVMTLQADVRSQSDLDSAVVAGLAEFGHIDVVSANAGVSSFAPIWEMTEEQWGDVLDINLSGVFRTIKAVAPAMIAQKTGGAIIITSSTAAYKGSPMSANYASSKAGLVALMHCAANALAPHSIRVNTIHPTGVGTEMIHNPASLRRFMPGVEDPSIDQLRDKFSANNALPVPWVEPNDISEAVLWLASEGARYVTGISLPVDAGALNRM